MNVVAIEIGFTVETGIAGAAIGFALDRIVLLERRYPVVIKSRVVYVSSWPGESRIRARQRAASKSTLTS
jgi:hypothetical protein